jgi:hypothetical protein
VRCDVETEGRRELGQLRQPVLIRDDADALGHAPRARQRLHHIEAR